MRATICLLLLTCGLVAIANGADVMGSLYVLSAAVALALLPRC